MAESNAMTFAPASAATAEHVAEHAARAGRELFASRLRSSSRRRGDERALDVGTRRRNARARAGAARRGGRRRRPRPRAARARARDAPANVTFVEGDATKLPFADGSFDLVVHAAHAASRRASRACGRRARPRRPRRADRSSSTTRSHRSTRSPRSTLDRFERARDPSHTRTLPDVDLVQLFEANGLVLLRSARSRRTRASSTTTSASPAAKGERRRAGTGALARGP